MATTTQTDREQVNLAAAALRRDDDANSRALFTVLLDRHGREGASKVWAQALDIVEAEPLGDPCLTPTRRAPDCAAFCGESYVDEGCEPCQVLEAVRYPAVDAAPHTCACGAVIPADQHEAIFNHIDTCPST